MKVQDDKKSIVRMKIKIEKSEQKEFFYHDLT